MEVSALILFSRILLSIFLLVNIYHSVSGSDVQGDCSKDGSCDGEQEKRGKEKYIIKGTVFNNFCYDFRKK